MKKTLIGLMLMVAVLLTTCMVTSTTTAVASVGAQPGKYSSALQVGDYVTFGSYEQDNNLTNGQEPIEWLVLDVKDGKALLLSTYALDCQPYNEKALDATWATCTLRVWLNSKFYNTAFKGAEKDHVVLSYIAADRNPNYGVNPGNDTYDKVFILSLDEVNRYFVSDKDRLCSMTRYAIANGVSERGYFNAYGEPTCYWCVRTPGYMLTNVLGVDIYGEAHNDVGWLVNNDSFGVRPALWIDIDSTSVLTESSQPTSAPKSTTTSIPKPTATPKPTSQTNKNSNVKVGNYVTFGSYEQDNNLKNGQEPIEWLVLDVQDGKALLLSRYALDCQAYDDYSIYVTWKTSPLRAWLNKDFMSKAFTSQEQQAILTTTVDNSKSQCYSGWDSKGGNNTQDKVFLLSYAEANKYLNVRYYDSDDWERNSNNIKARTSPTAYVEDQMVYTDNNYVTSEGAPACEWWLRSPGFSQDYAAFVDIGGTLSSWFSHCASIAIRPAMWINLGS